MGKESALFSESSQSKNCRKRTQSIHIYIVFRQTNSTPVHTIEYNGETCFLIVTIALFSSWRWWTVVFSQWTTKYFFVLVVPFFVKVYQILYDEWVLSFLFLNVPKIISARDSRPESTSRLRTARNTVLLFLLATELGVFIYAQSRSYPQTNLRIVGFHRALL